VSNVAVRVEKLGKRYRIGLAAERHDNIREALVHAIGAPYRNLKRLRGLGTFAATDERDVVWALRDVSFEVGHGEVLGIIGRNGAGKSTLLKILSRITEPTTGRVELHGRVGALLEVGTGFHPELTGRENVYLNGSILGMDRRYIARTFDEIVEFAGVGRFVDTPVKRYSSGMYLRLAFAVAAHLEPDILVVDEVLAVGDAEFQKKCLGKMEEVAREGRTVLFVSHQLNAIEELCNTAILLDSGRVQQHSSEVGRIVRDYIRLSAGGDEATEWLNTAGTFSNPWFTPSRLALLGPEGNPLHMPIGNDSEIRVQIEGEIGQTDPSLIIGYAIYTEKNELLYWSYQTDMEEGRRPVLAAGRCVLRSRVPRRLLNEGAYRIELIAGLHCQSWLVEPDRDSPSVYLTIQGGLSDSSYWMERRPGHLAPLLDWETLPGGSTGSLEAGGVVRRRQVESRP